MKAVVLALCVGGGAGLWLGGNDVPRAADPWLAEALRGLKGGDPVRAARAVEAHLAAAPDDASAWLLHRRLSFERSCRAAMELGEHALANGNKGGAAAAYRGLHAACPQRRFAQARLDQLGH